MLAARSSTVLVFRPAGSIAEVPVDDRRLIAKATSEGTLIYYAGLSAEQTAAVVARFEATYPIKVQSLRMTGLQLLSRVATEQAAGHLAADVMDQAGIEVHELKREGLLASFPLPDRAAFLPGMVDPDGCFAAIFINTEIIAFNPVRLKALGLKPPTGWDALTAREWRGNFGLPAESHAWTSALMSFFGKERAQAMLRGYAANQPQLISSRTLAANAVATGELAAAANVYAAFSLGLKDRGRPVDFINPIPTFMEPDYVAIFKSAPHPNAAQLFARWYLSRDTQRWIRTDLNRISARKDVKNDPRLLDPKVRYVAVPDVGPNAANVIKEFKTLFNIPT